MPANPRGRGTLLHSKARPKLQRLGWKSGHEFIGVWLPSAAIVAGLFAPIPVRTAIWTVALAWMGIACVLNARQCSRTHCRYTGPYYLAMIVSVAVVGMGLIPLGPFSSWALLGLLILGGSYVICG